jgi:hypothetical protein
MHIGPRNIINGLVFGYDTGDDNRFYPGEPTTNLLPSPEHNGRFSTSNGWGSYNTNQYCGNNGCAQYWTIPSISSVSNNIITTSSTHQIRSFDVIRANSSGGGITAGVDYVAKKISDTQFSLHEYNSSQDGSQGYINPATGFFKVHDAYANDTRISVSASGFPTGWWGAPHLPNSGLIKEVVSGGGRVPGTNCMRLHAYRPDGVTDGMAYGVYTPVTQGQVITLSFWHKAASPTSVGQSHSWSTYFYGYSAPSAGFTTQEYWQKHQTTWTASLTCSFYFYMWPSGLSTFDIADLQVEVKDHATPFTLSSRSSTASLIDMTKVNTIDVSNASFNSLGRPYFDGTNDSIIVSNHSSLKNNTTSIEFIIKYNSTPSGDIIQMGVGSGSYAQYYYRAYSGNSYWNWFPTGNASYGSITIPNSAFTIGQYYHVVMIGRSDSSVSFYINGIAQSGAAVSATSSVSTWTPANLTIGGYTWDGYSSSEIPVVKIYNRELSSAEITQHYYTYKTRFSLS